MSLPHFELTELIRTIGYAGIFFMVFAESGLFFGFFFPEAYGPASRTLSALCLFGHDLAGKEREDAPETLCRTGLPPSDRL